MHAVVNHLPIQIGVDWVALASAFETFEARLRAEFPAFRGLTLIRAGEDIGILLVTFDNREALDAISKDIAVPWFAEHVRPLLASSVSRSVGEVVAGSALR